MCVLQPPLRKSVHLVNPESVLVLDRDLLQDGLTHTGLPVATQRLPPTVTAVRSAVGGVFTHPIPDPLFHLHHCPVAVAQLEDVQVVLGINVLLHSAVLSRDGNNAGEDLIVQN